MSDFIEWGALGQVLVAGVLVGAGIPALFALGLRLLAGTTADATPVADPGEAPAPGAATATPRPTPLRLAGAIACLVVVVGAVATGLFVVVSGGH
ncbi:hypothetical protein ACH47X_26620 [Promicromonospora kroppenstedtii]|uniref:Uncharacterized protein n=1 Tax=Promicromonospora kroppenstedtii TaxID=440482 RepID=A0ABW7XSI2_9MICO